MKKQITSLIIVAIFLGWPLSVRALEVTGTGGQFARDHGSQPLGNVTVSMNNLEYPVTLTHGLKLLLPPSQWSLWEKKITTLQITGNAVERGKMAAEITPNYSKDLKTLSIPVLADWTAGDEMTIVGLKVRIYDRASGPIAIDVDVNGDNAADLNSGLLIRINQGDLRTDQLPPYAPLNVTATVLQNPWRVELKWEEPFDYDFLGFDLERTKNAQASIEYILSNTVETTYIDTQVQEGDRLNYLLYSVDRHINRSEAVITSVIVEASVAPETPANPASVVQETNQTEQNNASQVQSEEESLLTRLLSSFKVRFSIKCQPAGRKVLSNDSACLWAKIDLVYAQNRLSRSELNVSLSANDLRLMALRLPLNRNRYETKCANLSGTPSYCFALLRAVNRAEYLLNQNK